MAEPSKTQWEKTQAEGQEADAALVARIANGDMAAMRLLYDAYADSVHRFVRSRIRDEFEANDIVHETMLSVWRSAASFKGHARVRTWIFSLARNKAVDHIRRQSRVTLAEPDETIADEEPDAETVIMAAQDAEKLRHCLQQLSDRQRAVVHLAYYEDMTCAEIAAFEDIPEGTVKTRIYHAKSLLMRCLTRGRKKS